MIDTTAGGVAFNDYVAHNEVFVVVLFYVWCCRVVSLRNSMDDLVFVVRVNQL